MTKYGMIAAIVLAILAALGTGAKTVWDYELEKSAKIQSLTLEIGELSTEVKFLREEYGKCVEASQ